MGIVCFKVLIILGVFYIYLGLVVEVVEGKKIYFIKMFWGKCFSVILFLKF